MTPSLMTKTALAKSPASGPSPMITPYFSPNSLALKSLPTFKFLIPSVEQNLPIANGRSIEITLSLIAALAAIFSLNLRVSVAQTPVSRDGTATSISMPLLPPTLNSPRSCPTSVTSGAYEPTSTSSPFSAMSAPLNFTFAIFFLCLKFNHPILPRF